MLRRSIQRAETVRQHNSVDAVGHEEVDARGQACSVGWKSPVIRPQVRPQQANR